MRCAVLIKRARCTVLRERVCAVRYKERVCAVLYYERGLPVQRCAVLTVGTCRREGERERGRESARERGHTGGRRVWPMEQGETAGTNTLRLPTYPLAMRCPVLRNGMVLPGGERGGRADGVEEDVGPARGQHSLNLACFCANLACVTQISRSRGFRVFVKR